MTTRGRAVTAFAGLAVLGALATGCSADASSGSLDALQALPQVPTSSVPAETSSTTASPDRQRCEGEGLATKSLRPDALPTPGDMPAGSFMREIQDRGRLVVGVDQNTLGFGYRSRTGEIEGFDVSLVREIARAVFGDPDAVELRAVISAERVPAVVNGDVDLVASVMTMTCRRWEDIAFSSEYYRGVQRVLVRDDSTIKTLADLDGKTVCATRGSTSIDNLQALVPGATPFPVDTRTECLLDLQQGVVDAISTDDTILYGFRYQDPKTRLLDDELSDEPYGMGISQEHPEFVRFVNAVLENVRADGTWDALHRQLEDDLGIPPASPPAPEYRD